MTEKTRKFVVPDFMQEIVAEFDDKKLAFPEWELAGQLSEAGNTNKDMSQEQRSGWWSENVAFRFNPCGRDQSPWKVQFGPKTTFTTKSGTLVHCPDMAEIDGGTINYWRSRAVEAKNPILRARYADLVWEFSKPVTGEPASIDFARLAIDSYEESSKLTPGELMIDQIHRLERGLELAISIGDTNRIETVRDAMINFFYEAILPSSCGAWHFLFDNLYENKKAPICEVQLARMIEAHEKLLARYSDPEDKTNLNPWGAKEAAMRLARHYQKVGSSDDVKRVVGTYGNTFIALSREAGGMLAIAWLQEVYRDYVRFGMADEIDQLKLMLKQKGEAAESETKRVSGTITIPKDELETFQEEMTSDGLEIACQKIAGHFIPSTRDAQEELKRLHEEHPLISRIGVRQLGEQQIIAEIGSVEDDFEGRTIMQISENIGFSAPFLAAAMDRLRDRYTLTADDLLTILHQSPAFDEDRRAIICTGLTAYLEGDLLKAIHVLIPQVEHILRRLLGILGRPTNKHSRSNTGVMQENSLDEVLGDPTMRTALGDDLHRYLSMFLVDRRGHNLRNRLAHGLMSLGDFHRGIGDRVVHVLLILGMVRQEEGTQED
jgi:Domain of unknown function (DUF4209)